MRPDISTLVLDRSAADRADVDRLFGATGPPIIVAVTTIGVDHGELARSSAAALVGAGMLSVLVFPLPALAVRRVSRPGEGSEQRKLT